MYSRDTHAGNVSWSYLADEGEFVEEFACTNEYADSYIRGIDIFLPQKHIQTAYDILKSNPDLLSVTFLASERFHDDDDIRLEVSKVEFYLHDSIKNGLVATYRAWSKHSDDMYYVDLDMDGLYEVKA